MKGFNILYWSLFYLVKRKFASIFNSTREHQINMKQEQNTRRQNKVFDDEDTKKLFQKGLKFLAIALPLLFASPVLVTIGFKALNRGDGYIVLILGCLLAIFTIALVTQAFRLILKALFNR